MAILPDVKTTKGQIIYCLMERWPQNPKSIQHSLRHSFHHSLSYQAIHKTLHELETDEIIAHDAEGYLISSAWVEKLGSFSKDLKKTIQQARFTQTTKSPTHRELTFNTIVDLARYLLFEFMQRPASKDKLGITHWNKMYYLVGLSKEELDGISKHSKSYHWIITCRSKSIFDHMLAIMYRQMGMTVIFTDQLVSPDFDLWVWGDYVAHIYYPETVNKCWHQSKKVGNVDIPDFDYLIQSMVKPVGEIKVHEFKDEKLAQEYREKAKLLQSTQGKKS